MRPDVGTLQGKAADKRELRTVALGWRVGAIALWTLAIGLLLWAQEPQAPPVWPIALAVVLFLGGCASAGLAIWRRTRHHIERVQGRTPTRPAKPGPRPPAGAR